MRANRMAGPVLATLALAGTVGCASAPVHADWDAATGWNGVQTYAWAPEAPVTGAGVAGFDAELALRIRRAVEDALASRGYAQAAPDVADFWVAAYAGVREEVDRSVANSGRSHPGERRPVPEFGKGTLVLDAIDPSSEKVVWRGWKVGALRQDGAIAPRVKDAAEQILTKFPPEG